jgi:outer membrane protein
MKTLALLLLLIGAVNLRAVELRGTVQQSAGNRASVALEGDALPVAGDKAEIFFKLPGTDEDISVATARVEKIEGDSVQLTIENATGEVAKDQLVRITSANPQKRGAVTPATKSSATPATAATGAPTPSAGEAATGRNPSFAFVNMNTLFKGYSKTKDAEEKINRGKNAAKAEYDEKAAAYKRLLDEINRLNTKLESSGTADLASERDAKITRIKAMEKEINAFRMEREKELQDQALEFREGLVREMSQLVKGMAGNTNVVIDSSGLSLNGVPVATFSPPDADMTARVASALEAGQAGAAFSAPRDIPVALVDMNQIFKSLSATKRAEEKINDAKTAAKNEYDDRANDYKKRLDEINKLNQQLEGSGLSASARKQKAKTRDEKVTKIKEMEREINEFRQTREAQLQKQALQMREGIVKDITDGIAEKIGSRPALIFDKGGADTGGVALVVFSSGVPDLSDAVLARLNKTGSAGGNVSPVSSAGLRVATVNIARAVEARPEGKQAVEEIAARRKSAEAELTSADANVKQAKEKELQDWATKKRGTIAETLVAKLRPLAEAGGFNLVFNASGLTLNGVPLLLTTSDVPDLTDQLIAQK